MMQYGKEEHELYRLYFAELSEEARAEDAAWTRLAEDTAAENWPPCDGPESDRLKPKNDA